MGYWAYYLVIFGLSYGLRYPWLLGAVVVFWVFRKWIPDPFVYVRTFGLIRKLRMQIEANTANVPARRDLARIYLERRRPRAALKLLDEARQRDPKSAELLHLTGLARYRLGDFDGALAPLGDAVAEDARIGFGEPYLIAGDALMGLDRWEDAAEAYQHFVATNGSSIEGYVKLARARRRMRDDEGTKKAIAEAARTWAQIPAYRRRGQLRWWLRAWSGILG
ncbi:MAG: tetratricopeptide repeat protein [Sandaracinaceae bacterium]|nr:tetratricopeptide repeat protein [Sandaracinaceae bacterium]